MRHQEYRFVNVAANGAHNRQKVVHDLKKLGDPTGKTDTYCTYFRYNEEMVQHCNEKGTVSGFTGTAWSDWLPIDIDSEDLEEAQSKLKILIGNMESWDIDLNICRYYFSGAKGFHVMIPSELFQAVPSIDIHKRFRKVALELSKGLDIDTSIYDKTRIFRLPNTINSKTGLYKIELYPFEATNLTIEQIKQKAAQPSEKLEIDDDFYPNQELTILYHEDLNKPKKNKDSNKVNVKTCMQTLMKGIGEGERDNAGVRVASHLKQSGLTPKMMWVALEEWNGNNNPPLETDELERIFEQGLQDYQFGCHDHMLKERCDPNCIFYKEEWGRFDER